MKIGLFLQARIGSYRLPQKILRKIHGKPLVYHIVQRLKKIKPLINGFVIVTCEKSYPYLLELFKDDLDIHLFVGSEENVLERFYCANKVFQFDHVIRATADNPFTSIGHLVWLLKKHLGGMYDYSNIQGLPIGCGVEIFRGSVLDYTYHHSSEKYQFEHVTPYIYQNPDQFNIQSLQVGSVYNRPDLRLTIDEINDFNLVSRIFQDLYNGQVNDIPLRKIIELCDEKKLYMMNQMVVQKTLV